MLLTNSTRAFSVWVKALKTSDQAFSCFLVFFFFRIDRKKKKTGTAQQYFRDMAP